MGKDFQLVRASSKPLNSCEQIDASSTELLINTYGPMAMGINSIYWFLCNPKWNSNTFTSERIDFVVEASSSISSVVGAIVDSSIFGSYSRISIKTSLSPD
ncbi:hypothetical protein BDB01DRAFT_839115 [Pilobolus umbonatus]|nr:hypothetical protein BDB01DRAFT_839115 [Pilobolus umbonatus]